MLYFIVLVIASCITHCKSGTLTQTFIQNKFDLAHFDNLQRSGYEDIRLELSEKEQCDCSDLEMMLSCNSMIYPTKLTQEANLVADNVFLRGKLPKQIFTGTLVSLFFNLFLRENTLSMLDDISNLIKIYRTLNFDSYAFGCFYELLAFGSKKNGPRDNINQFYVAIFEKLIQEETLYPFFGLVSKINFFLAKHSQIPIQPQFVSRLKALQKINSVADIFDSNKTIIKSPLIINYLNVAIATFEAQFLLLC